MLAAAVLAAVGPYLVQADSPERFVGRLRCSDPTTGLRSGSFELGVGDVRLDGGKGCVKTFADSPTCDWTVQLTRVERWGPASQRLLVVVNANHETGSGAWDSLFMFVCEGGMFRTVLSRRYRSGAKIEVGPTSDFAVTTGEWSSSDPGCCPSLERRTVYAWDGRHGRFVVRESSVKPRPQR